ncbi:GNAT family protein [Paenibacillus sp. UMB7766-LJ446]|jgi:RimJ/RimL family protein N-acetyltransferase|uniref:GNAT family N-acetyltransferase n=1 Tax=unclassified Paenibacillus TaxID=185978 RepID=UPI0009A420E5|nr:MULTISPECIES: GNAT family protein [unclassified Paenibacillus]MDK8194775.1 GNAT family protein [Paenibacillus sp. UMB7766-LJ446]MDN8592148.1 GNAT family protein [Paenibacillus sp. 11B]OPG99024.1 GNAT family N-acetyltransferase [Chryseobacterium mucoviscidosis]
MDEAPVTFHVVPMQEEHAELICDWQYDPPYNIYSWLPWEQMKALEVEFGDPQLRKEQYAVVLGEDHQIWGFAQYFPLEGVTRIGLGMHPERCGHGQGTAFVSAIVKEALRRNPANEIDLEVLTWNERAIRVYLKAGFVTQDTYERQTPSGLKPFYCMVYEGPRD